MMPNRAHAIFETRDCCPACGSSDTRTRFASSFAEPPIGPFIESFYKIDPAILDGAYRAEQCNSCFTFFQAEVGDAALLEKLYTQWVFEIGDPMRDPLYAFDIAHPRLSRDGHELMAVAASLGLSLPALRTLDFGMGWAAWARVAQMLGCQSFGYDLSRERMDYAAALGIRAPDAGERFHFINTEQVFEHLTDPLGTARLLTDALLPGGILKLSVPSPHGLDRLFDSLAGRDDVSYEEIMPLQPLEHVNGFSRAGLRALAERVALRPVQPSIARSYAFLRQPRALDVRKPMKVAKEMVRPFYQRFNPRNHYVWFQMPTS
jgi:SAM-dependent methyltransferase